MRTYLALAIAGTLGVLARHTVQNLVPRHGSIPWGTFVVNITGALAIGVVVSVVVHRFETPMWVQEALTVGFLGGYTTFSALALETFVLVETGRYVQAVGYSLGTMTGGLAAVFIGLRLGRLV
jgi:fluoride exporter